MDAQGSMHGHISLYSYIHGSISHVRVGKGSIGYGQGQQLKFALILALNAQKREVITDGQTDRPTDRYSDILSRVHATKKY